MTDDTKVRDDEQRGRTASADDEAREQAADAEREFGEVGATRTEADLPDEVGILRDELAKSREELDRLREEMADARRDAEEARDKFLRARADLENVRRRTAADVQRAREAGLDSAVINVLNVYDDLGRALQVADDDDPAKILPGIKAVRDSLERNLGALDIERVGAEGEEFDPDVHEALSSVPAADDAQAGTIASVFQAGFKRGDRLIRPARVVVYGEPEQSEPSGDAH